MQRANRQTFGQTIEKDALSALLPHKGRMFLLDRVTAWNCDDWTLESQTALTERFMFYDAASGGVPAWAAFELMAQSVSALTSIDAHLHGLPANMGMILSVAAMRFDRPLLFAPCTATVRVRRDAAVDSVYSFSGTLLVDGAECASGKITVMEKKE